MRGGTARRGAANPEPMNNRVWEWLIKSRVSAYRAGVLFEKAGPFPDDPGWSFQRFGQSTTLLPDGRQVFIAGEHEDFYDMDFFIYNDVVVQHPDGHLDVYGYSPLVFPPTDFHSATLVGGRIVIIGSLGYVHSRRPGFTPVFVLNLDDFSMAEVQTVGAPPGWIHEHSATLSDKGDSIIIQKGQLQRDGGQSLVENTDDWELSLTDFQWRCLVKRNWPRREVRRVDGQPNHVWEVRMLKWGQSCAESDWFLKNMEDLTQKLGVMPDFDAFDRLYRPSISHEEVIAEGNGYHVSRIRVNGVIVRYVQKTHGVKVTVEGELPTAIVDALVSELRDQMSRLENSPCEIKEL